MFKKLRNIVPLLLTIVAIVVGTLVVMVEPSLAQDAADSASSASATIANVDNTDPLVNVYDQSLVTFASLISIVLSFLNYLIWPVLVMIGALMDNDLITGAGMEERLLVIWSQVRNFINLGFAFAMVGIAIYNVFGFDVDGNYAIKKVLPRFVLGLVLVNFSFLGCKVILDGANVVTQAVFAIPSAVQAEYKDDKSDKLAQELCKTVKSIDESSAAFVQNNQANFGQLSESLCSDKSTFTPFAKDFFQSFSHNNMALVMAVQFGRITSLLDTSDFVRTNPSLLNLVVNTLFSVTLYIVYATSYIALLMVLLARVVVLWIVLALSPLIALKLSLPEGLDIDGLGSIEEEFTKHLVAPIKIGFGMTVGFIMLTALEQVGPTALNASFANQFLAPFPGVSTIQELIIMAATVALTWTIVMDAASDTRASNFVDTIKNFVRSRGEEVAKLPLYAPLAPSISSASSSFNFADSINSLSFNARDFFKPAEEKKDNDTSSQPVKLTSNNVITNIGKIGSLSQADALATLRTILADDNLKKSDKITLENISNLATQANFPNVPMVVDEYERLLDNNSLKDKTQTLQTASRKAGSSLTSALKKIEDGLPAATQPPKNP